jgi:hypothetical protein
MLFYAEMDDFGGVVILGKVVCQSQKTYRREEGKGKMS